MIFLNILLWNVQTHDKVEFYSQHLPRLHHEHFITLALSLIEYSINPS